MYLLGYLMNWRLRTTWKIHSYQHTWACCNVSPRNKTQFCWSFFLSKMLANIAEKLWAITFMLLYTPCLHRRWLKSRLSTPRLWSSWLELGIMKYYPWFKDCKGVISRTHIVVPTEKAVSYRSKRKDNVLKMSWLFVYSTCVLRGYGLDGKNILMIARYLWR